MDEKLEALLQLPLKTKLAILVGLLLIFAGGYYYLFYSGTAEELASLHEEVDGTNGLRVQITRKEAIARNLPIFLAEVDKLDEELQKALDELPDRKEIAQLLSRISERARNAGLEIKVFKPQPEVKREFYADVPVEIDVTGSFHQVATFFDEVGRLERIVNLDQITLTDPQLQEGKASIKSTMLATSFRFLEEGERPSAGADGDQTHKTRRRRSSTAQ